MVLQICIFISMLFSKNSAVDHGHRDDTGIQPGTLECKSSLYQLYCQIKCGMKPAMCVNGECHCVSILPAAKNNPEINDRIIQKDQQDIPNPKYITDDETDEMDDSADTYYPIGPEIPQFQLESVYAMRPTVRHHIAHFCPNLDVARQCIRECMVQGKPAFCGKDHVCYCGHKYVHTGKDEGADPQQMYAQFKDLYTKYFGPNVENTFDVDV